MTIDRLNYLSIVLLDSDIDVADYVDLLELVKQEIEHTEPCFWCKDNVPMVVEKETDKGYQGDVLLSPISYCPNCGRLLKKQKEVE